MAMSDKQCAELYEKAYAAGMEAGAAAYDEVNWWPCGFGWVDVKPANCKFAVWMRNKGYAKKSGYKPGAYIWVGEFNQSMDAKYAFAVAFAGVLKEAGVKAEAGSRMD